MSNLTASRDDQRQDGQLLSYPVAGSTKLFQGSVVAVNTDGYADKAADTSGFALAGVAYETVDNSSGSDGALKIRVWRKGVVDLNFSGTASQATVGQPVYMVDDHTVAVAGTTTNDVIVGRVVEFISATEVRVELSAV